MKPIFTAFNKTHAKAPKASRLYLKLRSKLLFLYLATVILPLTICILYFYFITEMSSEKNFYASSTASLPVAENLSEQLIGGLEEFANQAISHIENNNISSYILTNASSNFTGIMESEADIAITEGLKGAYIINDDLILKLYSKNDKNAVISKPAKQTWYIQALKNQDKPASDVCIRFSEDGSSEPVFTIAKAIKGKNKSSTPPILLLDFDYRMLKELSSSICTNMPSDCDFLIINSNNCIIYSEDQSMLTLRADPTIQGFIANSDNSLQSTSSIVNYNGSNWYAVYRKAPQLSWSFVFMISQANVFTNYLPFGAVTVIIIIASILTVLIIFPIFLLKLLNPINKLTSVISDQVRITTSINQKTEGLYKQTPTSAFNAASSDLDYLIDKIYSLNLKQKEAELNALQNQINPHFLYNTLESIRGAALFHGIHDIAAMSKALSLMFRYSINSTVLVTVKEEIQHLENYMSIQNFRYENKFELSYEIPYDFYNYRTLKLSLQPLIENSIKHGLEMKLGKGAIKVAMFSLDNSIRIQVSDDGIGMTQKRIDEMNKMLDRDEYSPNSPESSDKLGAGIGVRNVNSRIKLYFGEAYGLKFQNTLSGTMVEIILPTVKE